MNTPAVETQAPAAPTGHARHPKRGKLEKVTSWVSLVGAILGVAGGLGLGPQAPAAAARVLTSWTSPGMPNHRVIFVTNDLNELKPYGDVIARMGDATVLGFLRPDEMGRLLDERPGLVILGAIEKEQIPSSFDPRLRSFLLGEAKVIAMGAHAGDIFHAIQPTSFLATRNATSVVTSVVSTSPSLPEPMKRVLPQLTQVDVYRDAHQAPAVEAVLNAGALALQGVTGIAESADEGGSCQHAWPVALQGNHVFWGFEGEALSAEGSSLFEGVTTELLSTTLQPPSAQENFWPAGSYKGKTLSCDFPEDEYWLKVAGPGNITVSVSSDQKLTLELSPPVTLEPEKTAPSSKLTVTQGVTSEMLNQGDEWLVTIRYEDAHLWSPRAKYDVDFGYPAKTISSGSAWLILIGLAGSIIFLLGAVALFVIPKLRRGSSLPSPGKPVEE